MKPYTLTQWWLAIWAMLFTASGIDHLNDYECLAGVCCAVGAGAIIPLCRHICENVTKD